MKLGADSMAYDMERLRVVRDAVGADRQVIVDLTFSLDFERALTWLPAWHEFSIAGVQAPFPTGAWEDMRLLNRQVPVIGIESESREEIFCHLLSIEALGMMQFSPIAAGGISRGRRLILRAAKAGVPVTLQCSSSGLAYMASLHLAAAFPKTVNSVELHRIHDTFYDCLPRSALTVTDGAVSLGEEAGLGFAPDAAELPPPAVVLEA